MHKTLKRSSITMKRLLLITMLLSTGMLYTYGQQDKILTHFIFDKMSINPGATGVGMNHQVCGTMIYRNQWDKFNGAPNSVLVNAEANLSQYFLVQQVFHSTMTQLVFLDKTT